MPDTDFTSYGCPSDTNKMAVPSANRVYVELRQKIGEVAEKHIGIIFPCLLALH